MVTRYCRTSSQADEVEETVASKHLARFYWDEDLIAEHNRHVVSLALANPVLFNAMMTKTLTEFSGVGGCLSTDLIPRAHDKESLSAKVDFAFFKVQTLNWLRRCLDKEAKTGIEPATMFAILFLIKNEVRPAALAEARSIGLKFRLSADGCDSSWGELSRKWRHICEPCDFSFEWG